MTVLSITAPSIMSDHCSFQILTENIDSKGKLQLIGSTVHMLLGLLSCAICHKKNTSCCNTLELGSIADILRGAEAYKRVKKMTENTQKPTTNIHYNISFMPPRRNAVNKAERNCIHCGKSYSIYGIDSHEQRYCTDRPQIQTQAEISEVQAFSMLVRNELDGSMSLFMC